VLRGMIAGIPADRLGIVMAAPSRVASATRMISPTALRR